MGTIINYEILKEIVTKEELYIKEELEVEDIGNFCVHGMKTAPNKETIHEYIAVSTDKSGDTTIIKLTKGAIAYSTKPYDINTIISAAKSFLEKHPTIVKIEKKEFQKEIDELVTKSLTIYNPDDDKENN